jgi:glutamate dehydrogenase
LWDDKNIRRKVLAKAFPKRLQELVGLDELINRLPEPYQQAVFGYYIASRYVYKYGLSGREFAFFEFMSNFESEGL